MHPAACPFSSCLTLFVQDEREEGRQAFSSRQFDVRQDRFLLVLGDGERFSPASERQSSFECKVLSDCSGGPGRVAQLLGRGIREPVYPDCRRSVQNRDLVEPSRPAHAATLHDYVLSCPKGARALPSGGQRPILSSSVTASSEVKAPRR